MRTSISALVVAAAAAALLAGCVPPKEEDEIQKTMRMYEQTKRQGTAVGDGRNVYVSVERISVARERADALGALWRYSSGRLTLSGADGLARGGLRSGPVGDGFEAHVSAFAQREKTASRTTAEIAVLSGAEGVLWVGRDHLVPLLRLGGGGAVEVLENVRVGAGLRVRPRLLGDGSIELDLAPSFSVLSGPRRGRNIVVDSMSTRVVVRPGQRLLLGSGSSAGEDSAAAGLFGYNSAGSRVSTLIVVKAERM